MKKSILAFFLCLWLPLNRQASQPPNVFGPPDILTLRASKSGVDVVLSCTDGFGPFQFTSNLLPNFTDAASFTSATGATCAATYAGALSQATSAYYLATDAAAGPTIFVMTPLYGQPGDTITLRGTNLDGATVVAPGGQNLPLTFNSRDTITFTVPATGMAGGPIQIYNTRTYLKGATSDKEPEAPAATFPGAALSPFFMPYFFKPTVNNDLFHVAFYQDASNTVRRMMVSGREGATNPRIYIVNPDTLALTSFITTQRSPMGMSLGVLTDAKPYAFFGAGQPIPSATILDLYKLDFLAASPVQSIFRRLSNDMTLDPISVRATSFVATDGVNENSAFSFSPVIPKDIRQAKEITTGVTPAWALNNVWTGTTTNRNYPGGLGVRSRTAAINPLFFHISNGQNVVGLPTLSRAEFWSTATTGNPPAHTKLWTADLWQWPPPSGLHPIVNAAQIELEKFGSQHAFVADRGNVTFDPNAISQIHKINTDYCNLVSCSTFVSTFSYGRRLLDARGVAVETGKNAFDNPYSKWLWAAHQLPAGGPIIGAGVSKIRALRELPLEVILTTNAGWTAVTNEYKNNGVSVMWPPPDPHYQKIDQFTLAQFTIDSVNRANEILYDVGYQINFDPTVHFKVVDDSGIATIPPHTYRTRNAGTCSPEISSLISLAAPNPKRIPIMIVHAIGRANTDPIQYERANGIIDYYPTPCGGMNWMILINPVSSGLNPAPGTNICQFAPYDAKDCYGPTTYNTFAHELYHRLTWQIGITILNAFGFDSSGHKLIPCPNDLMCSEGEYPASPGFRTSGIGPTNKDDDLANTDSNGTNINPGSTLILPDNGAP